MKNILVTLIILSLAVQNAGAGYLPSVALAKEDALRPQASTQKANEIAADLVVVYAPADKMKTSFPGEDQLPKISAEKIEQFRQHLGIEEDDLLSAAGRFPQLVNYNPERVKGDFEKELGIGKKDLAEAVLKYPQLVSVSVKRAKESFQRELGIGKDDLAKAVLEHPRFISYNPKIVKEDFQRELGIGKDDLAKAVLTCPRLAGYNIQIVKEDFQRELGIGKKDLAGILLKAPALAGFKLKRAKEDFQRELGIGRGDLAKAILTFPALVQLSPKRVKEDFERELDIGKKALAAAILKYPSLAGHNPKNLKENFERELGISKRILASLIARFPNIAGRDLGRLRQDFEREFGIDKEALAGAVVKFPQLAGLSITDNLKHKMQIADNMGVKKEERADALIAMASSNVALITLIWEKSLRLNIQIDTPWKLVHKYRAVNTHIKDQTGKYASALIKTFPEETTPLIEEVITQILQGKSKSEIVIPQRLIDIASQVAEKQAKSSSAGAIGSDDIAEASRMYMLKGDGTSPAKIVEGHAAMLSSYSASDIIRSVKIGEIEGELGELELMTEAIAAEIDEENEADPRLAIKLINLIQGYFSQVREYYDEQLKKPQAPRRLVRDCAGTLMLFLDSDLQKANALDDVEKKALLHTLIEKVRKWGVFEKPLVRLSHPQKRRDLSKPSEDRTEQEQRMIEQRAQEEWRRFEAVQANMSSMYKNLEEVQRRRVNALKEKRDSFMAKAKDLLPAFDAEKDEDEKKAIGAKIKQYNNTAERLVADIADAEEVAEVYLIYQMVLMNLPRDIKGPDNLARQNRSVAGILYNDLYKLISARRDGLDLSKDLDKRMYLKMGENLRVLEDLIGHLHEVDPFYLSAPSEKEEYIILTEKEIGVPALLKLLASYRIRGIVTTQGTVGSHWIIVANQMGIPVLRLKDYKGDFQDIANLGDEVIMETVQGEGESSAFIRPDTAAKQRYALARIEQERFHDLCLGSVLSGATKQRGIPLDIYGNVATREDIYSILAQGGTGIGLTRTEIPLDIHATILKSYIEDLVSGVRNSPHRETLLFELVESILGDFRLFKEKTGPFTIRTLDIKWDKNEDILLKMPEEQRKEGFEFYMTKIGMKIFIIQLAAILIAADKIRQEGHAFKPTVIFPMVKDITDTNFIFSIALDQAMDLAEDKLTPEAGGLVWEGVYNQLVAARDNIAYGPMIETVESADNIDDIVNDPRIKTLSVGTNDFTEALLTEFFGIKVSRDDEHFEKYFFELNPVVLARLEKIAAAVGKWNAQNPDNLKTLGFCGEIASREKFLLFALHLAKKYSMPCYLSMPAEAMPVMEFFRSFVSEEEIAFFEGQIGFKTDGEAAERVAQIYSKIRESAEYQRRVAAEVLRMEELIVPKAIAVPSPRRAKDIFEKISQAA